MFFKRLRKKRLDEIVRQVKKKGLFKRYMLLVLGCFIVAFAFNVFFLKYNIVCFGISGLSIVANQFGINPSIFILIANIILLFVCYFALGVEETKNSLVGSIIFPIFTSITSGLIDIVNFENMELLVIAILGAVLTGIGYGIIFKSGFNIVKLLTICRTANDFIITLSISLSSNSITRLALFNILVASSVYPKLSILSSK